MDRAARVYSKDLSNFTHRCRAARQFLKEQAASLLSTTQASPDQSRFLTQRIDFVFDSLLREETHRLKPIQELPKRKRPPRLLLAPYRSVTRSTTKDSGARNYRSTGRSASSASGPRQLTPRPEAKKPRESSLAKRSLSKSMRPPQIFPDQRRVSRQQLLTPVLSTRRTDRLSLRPPGSAHFPPTKL